MINKEEIFKRLVYDTISYEEESLVRHLVLNAHIINSKVIVNAIVIVIMTAMNVIKI